MSNEKIVEKLREAAALFEAQGAEPFRVRAYRRAADTVAALEEDLNDRLEREGPQGLERLANIGKGIAAALAEMLVTGRWIRLERLRGEADPLRLFQSLPGVGPALAERVHDTLRVDTLEALEVAAHDGRLERVQGIGPRRAAAIRASLDARLRRVRYRAPPASADRPSVAQILDVDNAYRRQAADESLPKIAPRRFNLAGERWLPILHTARDGWHFTALFSNTARAHELGRTDDWVVVYYYDGNHRESQATVVTETRGPLSGRRVVRGREAECARHYEAAAA